MGTPVRHMLVDVQDLSKAIEYQIDITRTTLVREQLRKEEWSHIRVAVRLFNTMLQQAGRSAKKTIATDLKRQADDMNVAGRVNDGGRVVFAVDHNKKLFGRDSLQIWCLVRPMNPNMRAQQVSHDFVDRGPGLEGSMPNVQFGGHTSIPTRQPPAPVDQFQDMNDRMQRVTMNDTRPGMEGYMCPPDIAPQRQMTEQEELDGYQDPMAVQSVPGYQSVRPVSPVQQQQGGYYVDSYDDGPPDGYDDVQPSLQQQQQHQPHHQQHPVYDPNSAGFNAQPIRGVSSPTMQRHQSADSNINHPIEPTTAPLRAAPEPPIPQHVPPPPPTALPDKQSSASISESLSSVGSKPSIAPTDLSTEEEPPKPRPRPRPATATSGPSTPTQPQSAAPSLASLPPVNITDHANVQRAASFRSQASHTSTDSVYLQAHDNVRSVFFDAAKIEDCRFFHRFEEDQDRDERRKIIDSLMNDRENGDWLLRFNTNQTEYVLVVRFRNRTLHIPIQYNRLSSKYQIHDVPFSSVEDLLNYYHNHALSRQINVTLHEPVEATPVMEVDGYCYMPPIGDHR